MDKRDGAALVVLAGAAAALHAPAFLAGASYFSNDLTHIGFPWRALAAQELQRGTLPLWDPFAYLGMPLLGNMQSAVLHPFSLLTQLWAYWRVLPLLLAVQQAFACAGTYLWLRRLGRRRSAAAAGAAVWGLGGALVAGGQAPNLQATLATLPWLGLTFGRPLLTGVAAALTFLAGYPPLAALGAGVLVVLEAAEARSLEAFVRAAGSSASGVVLGALLAAAALAPGAELARRSVRAGGLSAAERLSNSLAPDELTALASPVLTRRIERTGNPPRPGLDRIVWEGPEGRREFAFRSEDRDPVRDASGMRFIPRLGVWAGFAGAALALAGLASLWRRPARGLALAGAAALPVLLSLGPGLGWTRGLWLGDGPLAYLRGPSRFATTAGLAMASAASLGAAALPTGGWAAPLVLGELVWLGWGYFPTLPLSDLARAGPLADRLGRELSGRRYFMEPTVDVWAYVDRDEESDAYRRFKNEAWLGFRWKLTGVSGAAARLRAAGGAFEPLVPAAAHEVMETLRTSSGTRRAELMAWAGVGVWLAHPGERAPGLRQGARTLWEWYENPLEAPPARKMTRREGGDLMRPFAQAPAPVGMPLSVGRPSSDRLVVDLGGGEAGTVFLAEPYYPGWRAYVDGEEAALRPALGAFTALDFPEGARKLRLRYDPASWAAGLALSVATGLGTAGVALVRLRAQAL